MKSKRICSQEVTRARLLASAKTLFTEQGWEATSLDRVAERAGYTRGAFYSNFENKEDLLLSLTEGILEEHIRKIADLDPEQEAKAWFAIFPRFGSWFILALDTWLLAQRNRQAKVRLGGVFRRLRGRLARFIQRSAQVRRTPLALSQNELSAAMIALRIGLVIQRKLEPDAFPEGTYARVVSLLLGLSEAGAQEP